MNSVQTLLIFSLLLLTINALSDKAEWTKFKLKYRRTYDSVEDRQRFKTFQKNLLRIQEHNTRYENNETSYKLGINKFSDVSPKEFNTNFVKYNRTVTDDPYYDTTDCYYWKSDQEIPDTFDWRTLNAVTDVKDERDYYEGYGWAFAIAGALETQLYLAIKSLVPLSSQNLIECFDPDDPTYYWGSFIDSVYRYVLLRGIMTESEYPYTGSIGECSQNDSGIHLEHLYDMFSECGIKQSLVVYGPVTTTIDASQLYNYEGGIVDGTMCSNDDNDLTQAVLIVGYGNEDGKEYWIVKNSWGVDWGEQGYLRIARLANNTCGIGSYPNFPYILRDGLDPDEMLI